MKWLDLSERNRSLLSLGLIVAVVLGGIDLLQAWASRGQGQDLRAHVREGDIVMLSSTTCIYCARAREWLAEQHVPHRECFIEKDAACLAEFQARGSRGTPTLVVRGQTLVGFNPQAVLETLSRRPAGPG